MTHDQLQNIVCHLIDQLETDTFREKARRTHSDFIRDRRLPLKDLILLLLSNMTSSIDHELFRYFPEQDMPVSAAAFCKQRDKLNPEALAYLNRLMVNQVPEHRRNGLRWLAVDGTTLNLPNHVSTAQVFGLTANAKRPQARLSQLLDLSNKLTLDVQISPLGTGERALITSRAWKRGVKSRRSRTDQISGDHTRRSNQERCQIHPEFVLQRPGIATR